MTGIVVDCKLDGFTSILIIALDDGTYVEIELTKYEVGYLAQTKPRSREGLSPAAQRYLAKILAKRKAG